MKVLDHLSWRKGRVVIISDPKVFELYARDFCQKLKQVKPDTVLLKIPSGETSKSRSVKEALEDQLIELGISRSDTLVAFGGGVVTDVVGFVAATYLRGISYIAIPTTLMGMVDAAIGGKNGINHPKGKNLMGSLHPPEDVFIEPKFLKTLPNEVFREGFIEVIKYGLIWDEDLFVRIERKEIGEKEYIAKSIQIKRVIVKKDPADNGLRRILNYGHLVAHAIEKCTNYAVSHGRAVWLGILIESHISYLKGYLSFEEFERIQELFLREEIRFATIPHLVGKELYEAMKSDKKAHQSVPRVVLLKRIGKALSFGGEYCTPLSYDDFMQSFSLIYNKSSIPDTIL